MKREHKFSPGISGLCLCLWGIGLALLGGCGGGGNAADPVADDALFIGGAAIQDGAPSQYSYNGAGDEVTDAKTGLVWKRCSEGQSWSAGTCSGTAATYTHEQALARAKTQTGWRLPSVNELSSLTDKSRVNPAIDITAFPATSNWFWTATPYAADASCAWSVDFNYGDVGDVYRSYAGHVRLVR